MPKINKTKFAILGILNRNPASGYDIKKFSDASIAHFWNENYGHIYPVLKKMEKTGLIEKKIEHSEGKPDRNIYSMTKKGKNDLNEWLEEKIGTCSARNEFLLKLVFSKDVPSKKISEKFVLEKNKFDVKLKELNEIEKKLLGSDDIKSSKVKNLWLIAVRYGIMDLDSKINWCDESISRLKKIK